MKIKIPRIKFIVVGFLLLQSADISAWASDGFFSTKNSPIESVRFEENQSSALSLEKNQNGETSKSGGFWVFGHQGLTHAQYNAVLDQIQSIYGPIIAAKGGKLVILRDWFSPIDNAWPYRIGRLYIIHMYGEMARDKGMTQDGYALVACHEIGHHLGGAPKMRHTAWKSVEGEADYFATLKCLRRVFSSSASESFTRTGGLNPLARKACSKSFSNAQDEAVCEREIMASLSIAKILDGWDGRSFSPSRLDTPSNRVVSETSEAHPDSQCRLDTYFQGALCPVPYTQDMDDQDPSVGACARSHDDQVGVRPLCWYKSAGTGRGRSKAFSSRLKGQIKVPEILREVQPANVWKDR